MEKSELRIVFMGTPEFAVESLQILVESGFNVVGVVTVPDKPAGRGQKLQFSPVKMYALEKGLPLLQPEKLKDPGFLEDLKAWNADLQIVVAFRMLPEIVWNMPPIGTFNLHASLLPQYRGAAPINWAIINGEKETGVTTFFLTHEIDTGKIIFREKIPIEELDTAGSVHDKLMHLGSSLVVKTVEAIINKKYAAVDQERLMPVAKILKPAPKIFKETCRINWAKDVKEIYDFVRGLNPYPGAWGELIMPNGEVLILKVFETQIRFFKHRKPFGQIGTDGKTFLDIAVRNGYIRLLSIQQAGKKIMSAEEFLRGYRGVL